MKTVLITGASRGIGRAAAILFASKGYNVAIGYHESGGAALDLAVQLNRERRCAECFRADIAFWEQAQSLVAAATDRFGVVDVLVNNAGVAWQGLFQSMSREKMDRVMAVNAMGAMYCAKAVLPQMISRKAGSIVNVSSIWGECGASCEVVYSASKAAVIGFTKALASEVGPSGIRVNCVAPGVVATEMTADLSRETMDGLADASALGRVGTAEDIAKAIFYLADDGCSPYVTGQVLGVNGGLYT